MNRFYRIDAGNAIFILHQFSQEVKYLHQAEIAFIIDHEIVTNLVVFRDIDYVTILKQKEFISMNLHKFKQFQSFLLGNDDQL
jgi:hypothetical protein